MRRLILLRPEPGLSASAARAEALGLEVVRHPLFAIQPIAAALPEGPFDALVLTSANAVRHAGGLLDAVRHLPAYAVGEATAEAARAAGIEPISVGSGGVDGLALPPGRLLHLTGKEHRTLENAVAIAVYHAAPIGDPLPDLAGAVVAVHSPAAGRRLAALAGADRGEAAIAAISLAAATACGPGWKSIAIAVAPDDSSLLALAAALCQSPAP